MHRERNAQVAPGLGHSRHLLHQSLHQLLGAAGLRRGPAGDDPDARLQSGGRRVDLQRLSADLHQRYPLHRISDRSARRPAGDFRLPGASGMRASLLLGTVEHLWSACLFFGLAGLGATGLWVPIITLVQRWFAYQRKGLALGVLSTGYGLGFAVMGVAFPWVVDHYSWRHAWYILGMMALAMVLPNALALRSDPADRGFRPWGQKGDPPPAPGKGRFKVPLRRILRDPNFWIIGASYFFLSYGLYGFTTFMVDYAEVSAQPTPRTGESSRQHSRLLPDPRRSDRSAALRLRRAQANHSFFQHGHHGAAERPSVRRGFMGHALHDHRRRGGVLRRHVPDLRGLRRGLLPAKRPWAPWPGPGPPFTAPAPF